MILTRAPLRIPLGGGGSDFPSYYLKHGGYVLGFAIDKYVHVALNQTLDGKIRLKYSKNECAYSTGELENRVAACALDFFGIKDGLEIVTFSDVPEGSGSGGSSSFCVALVLAIRQLKGLRIDPDILFEDAYHVERVMAGQPGGMQDQFFAAYGGAHCLELSKKETDTSRRGIEVERLLPRLKLVYTGTGRSDLGIASRQNAATELDNEAMLSNLEKVKEHGRLVERSIRDYKLDQVGRIFHEHWLNKKKRDAHISNPAVDELYKSGLDSGALGGKLIGLGGGGYILFYSNNGWIPDNEIKFGVDYSGAKVVYTTLK